MLPARAAAARIEITGLAGERVRRRLAGVDRAADGPGVVELDVLQQRGMRGLEADRREDAGEKPAARRPRHGLRLAVLPRYEHEPLGRTRTAALPVLPRHEHEPLEQMHVLLILEQRPVQRRDDRLPVLGAQRLGRDVLG